MQIRQGEGLDAELASAVIRCADDLAAKYEWPREELAALVMRRGIVQAVEVEAPVAPVKGHGALVGRFKVVVRDDLVEPFAFFLKVSKGCAALSGGVTSWLALGPNVATVGVLAAALADLYDVFKKVWDLTHRLDDEEWAVVSELAKSTTRRETLDGLSRLLPSLTEERILAVLTRFELGPGRPAHNFVRRDGEHWELIGV